MEGSVISLYTSERLHSRIISGGQWSCCLSPSAYTIVPLKAYPCPDVNCVTDNCHDRSRLWSLYKGQGLAPGLSYQTGEDLRSSHKGCDLAVGLRFKPGESCGACTKDLASPSVSPPSLYRFIDASRCMEQSADWSGACGVAIQRC
jgi:hypothetical protein